MASIGFCGYYINEKVFDFKGGLAIKHLKNKNGKEFDTSHVLTTTAYERVTAELSRYYVPLWGDDHAQPPPPQAAAPTPTGSTEGGGNKNSTSWLPIKVIEKK